MCDDKNICSLELVELVTGTFFNLRLHISWPGKSELELKSKTQVILPEEKEWPTEY